MTREDSTSCLMSNILLVTYSWPGSSAPQIDPCVAASSTAFLDEGKKLVLAVPRRVLGDPNDARPLALLAKPAQS